MKSISFVLFFVIACIGFSQDKFPDTWEIMRICHLWKSDEKPYLMKYEKRTPSLIELEFLELNKNIQNDIGFIIRNYGQLCYSVRFLSYSNALGFAVTRELFFANKMIPGQIISLMAEKDGIIYAQKKSRGYEASPFMKDLFNAWNLKYIFKANTLNTIFIDDDYFGETKTFSSIFDSSSGNIGVKMEDIYRFLFFQNVIKSENLKAPYVDLMVRYDSAIRGINSDDLEIIDKIKNITSIIKKLSGRWEYKIIESEKSYRFDFLNRYGVTALGISEELLNPRNNIYPEEFESSVRKYINGNNVNYFFPIQGIYYDSKIDTVVLLKYYELISQTSRDITFRITGFSYDAKVISDKELVFEANGEKGRVRIKWVFANNGTLIDEYYEIDSKWILYARFLKLSTNVSETN